MLRPTQHQPPVNINRARTPIKTIEKGNLMANLLIDMVEKSLMDQAQIIMVNMGKDQNSLSVLHMMLKKLLGPV